MEDNNPRPDWSRSKTGRAKPKFKDNSRKAVALRKARWLYVTRRNNATSVEDRRRAWEDYQTTLNYWNMF